MNDKMTPDKERENCPCRKAIINPFDAMMMVVVRRLDKAYHELKRSKPPAKEAEFALRNAKLSFYGELVRQSIETVFSPEEIIWTMILPEEKLPKRCKLFCQISMKSLTTLPNTGKMSTTFFVNA